VSAMPNMTQEDFRRMTSTKAATVTQGEAP